MGVSGLRAIFFDLDGTLLDDDEEGWLGCAREVCVDLASRTVGLDAERLLARYEEISAAYWREASRAVIRSPGGASEGRAIWRELWHQSLVDCGHPQEALTERALSVYRESRLRWYRLFDDAMGALEAIRSRIGPLALITNGPFDTQREKLVVTGLDRLFDVVLISGEVGVAKPDARIFERAARGLGVPPEAAWHIGDSLVSDVAGAHNAGLGAGIWLNRRGAVRPAGGPAPRYEIASLADLVKLVA